MNSYSKKDIFADDAKYEVCRTYHQHMILGLVTEYKSIGNRHR